MKIAKKDIALVMVLVAVIVAFCAYKFSLSPNLEAVEDEESKQASIQQQIDEVKARADQVPKMEKEIASWQVEVSDKLKPFHFGYLYEDGIMYLNNLEKQAEKEENSFAVNIPTYTVGETAFSSTVNGQGSFSGSSYMAGTTTYAFSYSLTGYDELKNFINYMIDEKDGSGVKSLDTMVINCTQGRSYFEGTISMTAYAVTDGNNTYKPQDLTEVEQGIRYDSIFGDLFTEDEEDTNDNE